MALDDYNAATARDIYLPSGSNNFARLWATEKLLQTLAEVGVVEVFEGGGNDPTGLTGYSTAKLWLNVSAGVTDAAGTIRSYIGGDATDIASWPELNRERFYDHISSGFASLNMRGASTSSAIAQSEVVLFANTTAATATIASGATECIICRTSGSTADVTIISADAPTVTINGDATGVVLNLANSQARLTIDPGDANNFVVSASHA
jgi:hypothetical protein